MSRVSLGPRCAGRDAGLCSGGRRTPVPEGVVVRPVCLDCARGRLGTAGTPWSVVSAVGSALSGGRMALSRAGSWAGAAHRQFSGRNVWALSRPEERPRASIAAASPGSDRVHSGPEAREEAAPSRADRGP